MVSPNDLTRQLVDHLAPALTSNQRHFAAEYVQKEVWSDTKGSSRREWVDVLSILNSAERVARIGVQDGLADALRRCVSDLADKGGSEVGWEDDLPIQNSNLPQHIQLLLNLSTPPTSQTHDFAQSYLHRPPVSMDTADQNLYEEIMAGPFTGDHWGKGYIEPEVGWTDSESSEGVTSTDEESGEDERIITPLSARSIRREEERSAQERKAKEGEERMRRAEEVLKGLDSAYWSTGGTDLVKLREGLYGWKDLVRANPAAIALAGKQDAPSVRLISASQLQREMLFALLGRPGVLFRFDDEGTCKIKTNHPIIQFFSQQALHGILSLVAKRATDIGIIRSFIAEAHVAPSSSTPSARSKTKQAFAQACQAVLASVDEWASRIELAFLRGVPDESTVPATSLALLHDLDDQFGEQIDNIVSLLPLSDDPTILLNSIYAMYSASPELKSQSRTLDLFIRTATPVWTALGSWLIDGMPLPSSLTSNAEDVIIDLDADDGGTIDPDLWIKRDRDVSWTDEDFWEAGFIVGSGGWPTWMGDTREMIIEAGKAQGFLNGMAGHEDTHAAWNAWKSLRRVLSSGDNGQQKLDIPDRVKLYLAPMCRLAAFRLRRLFEEDCGLQQHLEAIEGVMYLKAHLSTTRWLDSLFELIAKGKRWNDMSSLTASLRDAIDDEHDDYLNPSAFRVAPGRDAYHNSLKAPGNILRTLGNLRVGYKAPFPVSVLFTGTTLEFRSQVFGFLVQLDYARRMAYTISKRETGLRRARHRLIWFLQTIWLWLTDRVIEVQTQGYRQRLAQTSSLQEMIALELAHTRLMRDFAFQHDRTADIQDNIFAVMQVSVSLASADKPESSGSPRLRAPPLVSEGNSHLNGSDQASQTSDRGLRYSPDPLNVEEELRSRIAEVRAEVEKLSAEGGGEDVEADGRLIWGMLSFALGDWPDDF